MLDRALNWFMKTFGVPEPLAAPIFFVLCGLFVILLGLIAMKIVTRDRRSDEPRDDRRA